MGAFLIPFLVLQLFYAATLSNILNAPFNPAVNSLNEKLNDLSVLLPPELTNDINDLSEDDENLADLFDLNDAEDVPEIQNFEDKTELKFRLPIESVNIDYLRNAIVLKFHKQNAKSFAKSTKLDNEEKKSLQDNFMRFGKRSYEEYRPTNSLDEGFGDRNHGLRLERSHQTARDARGDNFMRFGRAGDAKNDFMRFGRSTSQDFMRFGRSVGNDFMRFGRTPNQNFMRFGRTPSQDFMRFGRIPSQDFMRFGRSPTQDFMRFGRAGEDNFMRFGRSAAHNDFMRFGRHSVKLPKNTNFMRYSRPDNFMRFGRTTPQSHDNFMRFGKSVQNSNDKNTSTSQPLMNKNELKQAVKLIHEADKNADNENPVDKAIKVLFDKHQQKDATTQSYELSDDENMQHNGNNDLDSDLDYFLKVSA